MATFKVDASFRVDREIDESSDLGRDVYHRVMRLEHGCQAYNLSENQVALLVSLDEHMALCKYIGMTDDEARETSVAQSFKVRSIRVIIRRAGNVFSHS